MRRGRTIPGMVLSAALLLPGLAAAEEVGAQPLKAVFDELDALKGRLATLESENESLRAAAQIPSGAVMAFDLANGCPDEWSLISDFEGRVIVGAHKDRAAEFGYRAIGGEEKHRLTVEQMPKHQHAFIGGVGGGEHDIQFKSAGKGIAKLKPGQTVTISAGKGEPFTNMPPYMALFFCKKD